MVVKYFLLIGAIGEERARIDGRTGDKSAAFVFLLAHIQRFRLFFGR
jgi:hypothetical protein